MVDDIEQRSGKVQNENDFPVTRNVTNIFSYTLGPRPQRDELLQDLYYDNFYQHNNRSTGAEQLVDQLTSFRTSRNNLVQDLRLHRSHPRDHYYTLSSAKMLQTLHHWTKLDARVLCTLKSIVINPSNIPFFSRLPCSDAHSSLFKVKESISVGRSFSLELLPSAIDIAADRPELEVCCTMDLQSSVSKMPLARLPAKLIVHGDWCSFPDFQLTGQESDHASPPQLPQLIYYMSCSGITDPEYIKDNVDHFKKDFARLLSARSAHMTLYTKLYHGGDGSDDDWRMTPERFAELTRSIEFSVQAEIEKSGSGSTITVCPDGTAAIPSCKHCGGTFLDYQEFAKAR